MLRCISCFLVCVSCLVGCDTRPGAGVPEAIYQKANAERPDRVWPSEKPSPAGRETSDSERTPFVVRGLQEWSIQKTAAESLGRIGRPAVPALVQTLRGGNPDLRRQAADTLARIGPNADEAVPDLVRALSDEDAQVRKSAARALGQIGPAAQAGVPALIRLLQETEGG